MPAKQSPRERFARAFTRATGYEIRKLGAPTTSFRSPAPLSTPAAPPKAPAKKAAAAPVTQADGAVPAKKSPAKKAAKKAARKAVRPAVTAAQMQSARESDGDRLLVKPTFVLSSVRSGSTLIRVMLNTHSQIHAPHELHLKNVIVRLAGKYAVSAMEELGADETELQYLLWDRILHRELTRNHKKILVNKTPNDALIWRELVECWPDAQFIFLLRHPAAVVDSWQRARVAWNRDQVAEDVLRYMDAVEDARLKHGGLTVRYEDTTADPERETQRICEFLGVPWEPGMVDYGAADHGEFKAGLGDWSGRIKSGKVLPAKPLPADDEIPASLRDLCKAWGYLGEAMPADELSTAPGEAPPAVG